MAGKILVIDDEKNIGELIQLALQAKGYRVEYATTGDAGLALFDRFGPDLALVDMKLPDMDGVSVARRIKQTDRGKTTPLLLLTGEPVARDSLDKGLFAGAVEKPISMSRLAGVIDEVLKKADPVSSR